MSTANPCSLSRITSSVVLGILMTGSTARPAEHKPTISEIVEGLRRSAWLLLEAPESFKIVCAREETEALGPKGNFLLGEWITARKGANWLTQVRGLNPPPDYPLGDDRTVYAARGQIGIDWTVNTRQCVVHDMKDGRNMYLNWEYIQNLGFDVFRHIAESSGVDYESVRRGGKYAFVLDRPYLPEFLERHIEQYHVRDEPEDVDGYACWVIDWPRMDCLWIDLEHGFAVRRRRYHWGPDKPLRYHILQRDFQEVRPGLWLPFTQIVDHFAVIPSADKDWWGKVINRSVYRVKDLEFDSVPDAFFDVRLPIGTMVTDTIRELQYSTTEKNADPFAPAIDSASQHLWRVPMRLRLIIMCGCLVLGLIVVLLLRMRH